MNAKLTGNRIKAAREAKGISREELGGRLGVSFETVDGWETGKIVPDIDHLPGLCSELELSIEILPAEKDRPWELKPVNDNCGRMFVFVRDRARMLGLPQTLAVLELLRAAHGSQERRSRNGFTTSYIVHPLTLACHALAMGLRDDDVLAACLAHDMVEDAGMAPEELPAGPRVQEAVRLVSKNLYSHAEEDWEDLYYQRIRQNPLACLVKCLDRVNNVTGMADVFPREKMIAYTAETDRYYPALLDVIRKVPEWNDAWWLIRYQLTALVETLKRVL